MKNIFTKILVLVTFPFSSAAYLIANFLQIPDCEDMETPLEWLEMLRSKED